MNVKYEISFRVPVINENKLPEYQTPDAAGADAYANLFDIKENLLFGAEVMRNDDGTINCVRINPGGRALISTGIKCKIPKGYEIRVQPRSGLALKNGITVLNSPGCVDSDYVGTIGVILMNHGTEPFDVHHNDRIAQLILSRVERISWAEVETLEETDRNSEGFGTTGIK